MAKKNRVGDLQIDNDIDFQRKEWKVERAGWVIMALLVLAALLGLFGDGPLANMRAENGPLQVQYQRFGRLLSSTQFVVQVGPEAAQNEEVRLTVERTLLDSLEFTAISPEPDGMELTPSTVVYVFKVKDSSGPVQIVFIMQTVKAGSHSGQIGLENGAAVKVSQFIYP